MKKSLITTNPYIRDEQRREQLLLRNVRDSSAFEGARGLKAPADYSTSRSERRNASRKKTVSG